MPRAVTRRLVEHLRTARYGSLPDWLFVTDVLGEFSPAARPWQGAQCASVRGEREAAGDQAGSSSDMTDSTRSIEVAGANLSSTLPS